MQSWKHAIINLENMQSLIIAVAITGNFNTPTSTLELQPELEPNPNPNPNWALERQPELEPTPNINGKPWPNGIPTSSQLFNIPCINLNPNPNPSDFFNSSTSHAAADLL